MQQEETNPAPSPRIRRGAIDPDAIKVIRRLKGSGFDAYLVGGCVRDLLLGIRPKDFDLATSARPRQIKRLFRNSRIIGRRFRLAHIRFGEKILEVATFRAPPESDGDDPYITRDNIFGTEKSDALRRDFTINGLFYDPEAQRVIDHVGGLEDLAARRLRTIGEAELRLREDPVRALRAAKFAGRLEFDCDEALTAAIRATAEDLSKTSPARVLEEFYKLLSGHGSARAFALLEEWGCLKVLLPEIAPLPAEFFEALERMEQESGGARNGISQGLMMAVLLAPLAVRAMQQQPVRSDHEAEVRIGDALRPVVVRMSVARKDSTIARQCLGAQIRFLDPPSRRGSRRFCFRPYFADALLLRKLLGPMEDLPDGGADAFQEWVELSDSLGARDAEPPMRHRPRRRRRGGQRRGRQRGAGAGPQEST
ncbi:MAG: polynucleotide adenylyltransferase PcnB [Planctomycetota bacterium]|jgi:poly(A) polymerase